MIFILYLIVSVFFEAVITTVPLTAALLLVWFAKHQKTYIFAVAFFLGIVLDGINVRIIGISSLFFVGFLGVALLYDRKFDINTWQFVLIASFVGSLLYSLIMGYEYATMQGVVSSLVAVGIFTAI